jgi:hypothetical protein
MKHYLGICLVLLTIAGISLFAVHSCTSAVNDTVDHVRDAFSKVLNVQPQVTVNQRVVLTQTAPIAEFAVVTKEEAIGIDYTAHYEVLSMHIPLTEKKITAQAVYRIKAGFDLQKPFSVEIDPATHAVTAEMPPAQLLSVEQVGEIAYSGFDATFNRVTDQERTEILASLHAAAREAAEKSTLKAEAEAQVTQRLKDIINHNGQSITIKWTTIPTPTPLSAP